MDVNSIGLGSVYTTSNTANNYITQPQVVSISSSIDQKQDYTDFSMDYSNTELWSVLNNINNQFDISEESYYSDAIIKAESDGILSTQYGGYEFLANSNTENSGIDRMMASSKSIADCGAQYGSILKSINSSSNFDDEDKNKLIAVLDKSYTDFIIKKASSYSIAGNFDSYFNMSYYRQEDDKKQGIDFGIRGDKLLDKAKFVNNVENMFSTAMTFYKNNNDATEDQFESCLNDKFSTTNSIDQISYHDFKLVASAINDIKDQGGFWKDDFKDEWTERLKEQGASSVVVDAFKSAMKQNVNCISRVKAYGAISGSYQDDIDKLLEQNSSDNDLIKALEKLKQELNKEYNEKLQKLKKAGLELAKMLQNMEAVFGKDEQKELLEKNHKLRLTALDEKISDIEKGITERTKILKETVKQYNSFLKSPADQITSYLKDQEKKKSSSTTNNSNQEVVTSNSEEITTKNDI